MTNLEKATHRLNIVNMRTRAWLLENKLPFPFYKVGTSAVQMEYNNEPRNWSEQHCIIYPHGEHSRVKVSDSGKWLAA